MVTRQPGGVVVVMPVPRPARNARQGCSDNVRVVHGLARDAEFAGDLSLGTALSEQRGGAQAAGLTSGAFSGRAGAAGGRHRRTLAHGQSSPST